MATIAQDNKKDVGVPKEEPIQKEETKVEETPKTEEPKDTVSAELEKAEVEPAKDIQKEDNAEDTDKLEDKPQEEKDQEQTETKEPEDKETKEKEAEGISVRSIDKDAPLKIDEEKEEEDNNPSEKKNKIYYFFGILGLTLITLSVVGFIFLFISSRQQQQKTVEPVKEEVKKEEKKPEKITLDKSKWVFEVLNGSTVSGAAGKLAEKLEEKGYTVVKIGNADNSEYTSNEILVSKDLMDKVLALTEDIREEIEFKADPEELTGASEDATVRIIIGN